MATCQSLPNILPPHPDNRFATSEPLYTWHQNLTTVSHRDELNGLNSLSHYGCVPSGFNAHGCFFCQGQISRF
uniref:Uncharacterized protein n=1 Tax=Arundo donax TaxID=35708 RepID=A0A0A9I0I9_ARUDO